MAYDDWSQLLSEQFPAVHEADRRWDEFKQLKTIDQEVLGTVIAKAPFGAWVDIGAGFPALLELPNIAGLTPEKYRADDWCPIGSQVQALIGRFDDRNRQIRLWQVKPRQSPVAPT
jgi:ribosomal protein S1